MSLAGQESPFLGWKEKVSFPAWGLTLNTLIDPSATLSTLIVTGVEPLGKIRDSDGRRRQVLRLAVPMAHGRDRLKIVYAFYHRRTRLAEQAERCYVIQAPMKLGEWEWEGELALLPGSRPRYFLHLGRSCLAGRFMLDPAEAYLHKPVRREFRPSVNLPLPESGDLFR
ncbi:MAG: hypothetical protein GY835_20975 [bacterium]|nr:hypothetical protein [bacterium]